MIHQLTAGPHPDAALKLEVKAGKQQSGIFEFSSGQTTSDVFL